MEFEWLKKIIKKGQFYGSLFQRIQFHGVVIENTQVNFKELYLIYKELLSFFIILE